MAEHAGRRYAQVGWSTPRQAFQFNFASHLAYSGPGQSKTGLSLMMIGSM
jgi:hypothetical protein